MQALFAISILSLSALLWASICMTRYILVARNRRSQTQRPREDFAEVLIEDKLARFRGHTRPTSQMRPAYTPPEPALLRPQPAPKHAAMSIAADLPSPATIVPPDIAATSISTPPITATPIAVASIVTPAIATPTIKASPIVAEAQVAKKAPQAVAYAEHRRMDWDYCNKDLGDPYEANARVRRN